MSRPAVEVLHVGSASRDIAEDDPRGWRLGGGVVYAALATARLGLRTAAVVGVDGPASTAIELEALRAAGVELRLVPLPESPVFVNTETSEGRVQLAVARGLPLEPVPLPDAWLAAPAWSLVPVAGEVGEGWLDLIPSGALVAVGWQGLLRTIVAGQRVERRAPARNGVLARADLVGVSHQDVVASTTLRELVAFVRPGARLLVTQGPGGGVLVTATTAGTPEVIRYLPTRSDGEVDPTGAGDTFLAALLATTLRPDLTGPGGQQRDGEDLRFAAAAGSLAVEGLGLAGVSDLAAVERRRSRERERVEHTDRPSLDDPVGEMSDRGGMPDRPAAPPEVST